MRSLRETNQFRHFFPDFRAVLESRRCHIRRREFLVHANPEVLILKFEEQAGGARCTTSAFPPRETWSRIHPGAFLEFGLSLRFSGAAPHRVANDKLRSAGLIKIKPAEILADQTENHELNSSEQHNGPQHGGNSKCHIWCNPEPVDHNGNARHDAQTRSEKTNVNRKPKGFNGEIQKHVEPKPDEASQRIARRSPKTDSMFHRDLADISGHAINQAIGIRVRAAILD